MRTVFFSLVLMTTFFSLLSSVVKADERSFGLGIGHLYNGFGVNYATRSKNSLSYASLGCLGFQQEYSSNSDDNSTESSSSSSGNCGLGGGLISTAYGSHYSPVHGIGIYGGLSYNAIDYSSDGVDFNTGISYTYFFSGISESGANLGVGLFTAIRLDDAKFNDFYSRSSIAFNLGYQF